MRPVYAVQFEVEPPHGSPSAEIPRVVQRMVADWVREWYIRNRPPAPDVPLDGGELHPDPGHILRVQRASPGGPDELWTLVWSHPSDRDDTLLWTSECVVAHADDRTEVSIVIRLESTAFRIAPSEVEVGRPRLVRRLIEDLPCRQTGRTLRVSPESLAVADMAGFIEGELLSSSRTLPVILFSRDSWTDGYLSNPDATADAVIGLAQVYILQDKWAAFALTNELGRNLACFNGAVRVYWPGLTRASDPYRHLLLLPDRLRAFEAEGRRLADVLFRRLAPISAVRFMQGPIAKKVRASLLLAEANRREQIRRGLVEKAELEELLLLTEDEHKRLREENRRHLEDLEEAQLRILELEEESRDIKASFAQIREYESGRPSEAARPTRDVDVEFGSVREALDKAAREFREHLDVWRSAEESADKSAFARPAQAYQALLAIKEVAEAYFKSKTSGRPMGPWEKAFGERGFKYAANESQNTMNMFGGERIFVHKGRKLQMQRHLTLGGGDRQNCLQIYFEVDEAQQRFVVGYCGVHLPYYGMTT